MTWHYQVCKRKCPKTGEIMVGIVESYPWGAKVTNDPMSMSVDYMSPYGHTKAELLRDIEMMWHDALRYPMVDDTKIPGRRKRARRRSTNSK